MWIWRAWWRLHRDRPWYGGGMGPMVPGRIPLASVVDWCRRCKLGEDAIEFLDACFDEMDRVHAEVYAASLPKSGKP